MNKKQIYLDYCGRLFDLSVDFQKAKDEVNKSGLTQNGFVAAKTKQDAVENKFLACCKDIEDEYNATNPKTIEVKGLLEYKNAIYQGHYPTP